MRLEWLRPGAAEWEKFLGETEHDFYHLPEYVRLCAESEQAEAYALLIQDDEGRQLLLPLLLRPVTARLRDATSPYGYPGPLLLGTDDPAFVDAAMTAITPMLAAAGIVSLFVRGHPFVGPPLSGVAGTLVEHGSTLSIDLTRPADVLWHQTMSGHRKDISRAIRLGHRADFDETPEGLGTFARIYRETMIRLNAMPSYHFSDDYFAALRHALGARLHVVLVTIGEAVAGGGIFVTTGRIVEYHLSGTAAAFVQERPTKLMLHMVRAWAKENGYSRLHLGGGVGGQDDSLFKFKAGFATDRHAFRTMRIVCDERLYADLVRAKDPTADPADRSAFFPLYRQP